MPVTYLTITGLKAHVSGERLELDIPPQPEAIHPQRRWIPLADIEHIVLDSKASLSGRSITKLLQHGIPILFMSNGSLPAGLATPMVQQPLILAAQIDASRDSSFRLHISRSIVRAKIRNMRRVIQRLAANRGQSAFAQSWLNAMGNQAGAAESIDSLRGIEGAATGRYFETIAPFFPEGLPFERRSRRPPLNPANALLSFLYTMIVSEFVMHLQSAGLHPGWGVYHETENNRPALALDLMEPFRAPLADSLALDLLNHRRLKVEDFEQVEKGWLLKRLSRRKIFGAWEDRLEREFRYDVTGERTTLRSLIKSQCLDIKRCFRESRDDYQPFWMN